MAEEIGGGWGIEIGKSKEDVSGSSEVSPHTALPKLTAGQRVETGLISLGSPGFVTGLGTDKDEDWRSVCPLIWSHWPEPLQLGQVGKCPRV